MQTGNAEAVSPSMAAADQQRILYCLDFDGVLCDSVHETFLSGWRACKILWLHNGDNGNEKTWIDALEENTQKLNQLEEDFRCVRPILYVGWEAILLIRLLAVGYEDEIVGTPLDVSNPSSTRDAVFRGFHHSGRGAATASSKGFRDHALETWGVSATDYGTAMSEARTTWIRESEESWIEAHGFYKGACKAVATYLNTRGNGDVYVITTKAKEFALRLLEKQDLFQSNNNNNNTNDNRNFSFESSLFKESHVFGLGSGSKASVLQQIIEARQAKEDSSEKAQPATQYVAVMVEDNIATLDKISKSEIGNKVLPVVASWGYNSVEQLADVLQASVNTSTTTTTTNKINRRQFYMILPLLQESSRLQECDTHSKAQKAAERSKQRDPTGCSLASILQTPSDAGNLLSVMIRDPTSSITNDVMNDELYDFSSNQDIALAWFRQNHN